MNKVIINPEACTGCRLCERDCTSHVIKMIDGKAVVTSDDCIKCGHCVAVCPVNAVSMSKHDKSEIIDLKGHKEVKPEELMTMIRSLRTVRHFKDEQVSDEDIIKIIEAGRYTATAGNRQHVRYIVVKDDIDAIELPILKRMLFLQKVLTVVAKVVKLPYDISSIPIKKNFLFKEAPVVILAVSDSVLDASLASRSMELMVKALGHGSLYVGFFTAIANSHRRVKAYLGIKKREKIVTCLAIGVPDIKFHRTVPRNEANVTWK